MSRELCKQTNSSKIKTFNFNARLSKPVTFEMLLEVKIRFTSGKIYFEREYLVFSFWNIFTQFSWVDVYKMNFSFLSEETEVVVKNNFIF